MGKLAILGSCLLLLVLAGCFGRTAPGQAGAPPAAPPPAAQQQPAPLSDWHWAFECTGALSDATPAELQSSPLDFVAGYLPVGFTLRAEIGAACQGKVRSLLRVYTAAGDTITVVRYAGRPGPIPTATDVLVGDRPALRDGNQVLLLEEFGLTTIQGSTEFGELRKVAQGIGNRAPTAEERRLMAASICAKVIREYVTALSERQVPQAFALLSVRYRDQLGKETALADSLRHVRQLKLVRSEQDDNRPHPPGTLQFRVELAADVDGDDPAWASGTNVRWVVLAWDEAKKEGKSWAIDSLSS